MSINTDDQCMNSTTGLTWGGTYINTTPSQVWTQVWTTSAYPQLTYYIPIPEKKENNTMELYNVYLVYAEDRKKPVVKRVDGVLAKNTEDAKVKSGLMKDVDPEWDSDYLNFICEHIGTVNVKPKPTEVKSV